MRMYDSYAASGTPLKETGFYFYNFLKVLARDALVSGVAFFSRHWDDF